ncbi:DUF1877 family protein [Streptomyces sp. V4I23]|uniref:DUF1877 family protein n=1 Tax=Streptomyces sp. V4I23 TaxID=3042282 RepID=UPI0027D809A0|nr:DUF1877 family protein [Streptomyces sp. V4I23]
MDHLERGFAGTLDNDRYQEEIGSGILCSLGEDWQMVNVLLTGEGFPPMGAECLPVLGGEHLATFDEHLDVLLLLRPEMVQTASTFLDGVDDRYLLRRHRSRLDARTVGAAPDWMVEALLAHIGELRQFYKRAAAANEAVAKRVYA